ncbi:MAG: DUF1737 domain-containing protein [Victivallaceae bacterium]|nr:DUF1737 domain-containing protein [Victivallaceae bacterium]
MSRKIRYYVIEDYDIIQFQNRINGYLDEGWMLQGGVAVLPIDMNNYKLAQAMTREIIDEPKS